VDKTLLIKEVFAGFLEPEVMITAPRKFGKSVNLEVEKLFEIFSVDEGLRKKAITKYNCYYTERGEHGIFNPYAIVRFLENHREGDASLKNYWQDSGYVQGLDILLKKDEVREMIRLMLQGKWFWSSGFSELLKLTELNIANKDSQSHIHTGLVRYFLQCQGYISYTRRRESLPTYGPTAVGIPADLRPVFVEKMVEHLTQHCGINAFAHKNCQSQLNNVMHFANKDKAAL
jgi:hypothetical protein